MFVGVLTSEQRRALNKKFGSAWNAVDEVIRLSAEASELWQERWNTILWPSQREFLEEFWKIGLPVLGIDAAPSAPSDTVSPSSPTVEPDLSGRPLPALAVLRALCLHAFDVSIRKVSEDKDVDLSFRGARRVNSWVVGGAVWWDHAQKKPMVAPGYRLVNGGTKDEPTVELVRV